MLDYWKDFDKAKEAVTVFNEWDVNKGFQEKRFGRHKWHFDELTEDILNPAWKIISE